MRSSAYARLWKMAGRTFGWAPASRSVSTASLHFPSRIATSPRKNRAGTSVSLQLHHAPEFALGLLEHCRLVERDAQIAVLFHARLAHAVVHGARFAGAMQIPSRREGVQRLPHLELADARRIDERRHVAPPIDQRDQLLLRRRELRFALRQARAVHLEDDVEARHLLLDQAPLVHAPRAFQQQRLGIDRARGRRAPRGACPPRS